MIAAESSDLMKGLLWAFTIVCGRPKLVTKTFQAAQYMTPEYPRPAKAALALPLTNVFE